ncbi:MAG TPA: translation initiation factor IF-2 N-terminal domain-containing protein, partial [Solirubrobacteraceae bacterium]
MSKKRVHEIAKEHGLSSKELLERLQTAGVAAKAAASSVEEADALRVLADHSVPATATAPKPAPATAPPANGTAKPAASALPAQSAPAAQATPAEAPLADLEPASPTTTQVAADGAAGPDSGAGTAAGERVRPTRDSRTGERTPASNSAGGRRRVVIDSQA